MKMGSCWPGNGANRSNRLKPQLLNSFDTLLLNSGSSPSLQLQEELSPADLERKWTKLNRVSGGFRELKDAVIASQGGDQQLVLVAVAFGKATSNLFVIFDQQGRIINVDISRDFV